MVKVRKGSQKGQTKLNRSGKRRARRTAHKSASNQPSKAVGEAIVRGSWDVSKTRMQNYERLGLLTEVNVKALAPASKKPSDTADAKAETEVVGKLQEFVAKGEEPALPRVVKGEFALVDKLTAKHGGDYDAMARDIQVNYLQWTAGQLRKKVKHVFGLRGEPLPSE